MKKPELINYTALSLVVLNLILKLIYISNTSIAGDEPFSIYHAQMGVKAIVAHLLTGNNPPLYEIFLHYWVKMFGISEFAVRFPSVAFSSLTVIFIFKIGKEFFSYKVGLVAGLLFTFSNLNLQLAHEARVYALFAFLTAISMYWFLKITSKPKLFRYFVFLLITNTFLVYSHYFGFFVIIIQTLSFLLIKEIRVTLYRNYFFYLLGLIFLYLPMSKVFVERFLESSIHGTWLTPPNGVESIYHMLRTFSNQPLTAVAFIIVMVVYTILHFSKTKTEIFSLPHKVILLWFVFPYFFMFSVSFWIPMFFDRYLIFITLGYYLLIAVFTVSIYAQHKINWAVIAVIVALFAFTFNPNMENKRHVKETVAKINELKTDSTRLIICPANFSINFTYYYNPAIFKDFDQKFVYNRVNDNLNKENVYPIDFMDNGLCDAKRIIYLDAAADFNVPGNNILSTLKQQYKLLNTYKFYKIFFVYEFEKE